MVNYLSINPILSSIMDEIYPVFTMSTELSAASPVKRKMKLYSLKKRKGNIIKSAFRGVKSFIGTSWCDKAFLK